VAALALQPAAFRRSPKPETFSSAPKIDLFKKPPAAYGFFCKHLYKQDSFLYDSAAKF